MEQHIIDTKQYIEQHTVDTKQYIEQHIVDTKQYIEHIIDTKQYIEQHIIDTKQYIEQHSSLIRKSADRGPSLRGIPWHLSYNWGKTQKNLSQGVTWFGKQPFCYNLCNPVCYNLCNIY